MNAHGQDGTTLCLNLSQEKLCVGLIYKTSGYAVFLTDDGKKSHKKKNRATFKQ